MWKFKGAMLGGNVAPKLSGETATGPAASLYEVGTEGAQPHVTVVSTTAMK